MTGHDDGAAEVDAGAEDRPANTAPAGNPFVLAGLPAYASLDPPAAPDETSHDKGRRSTYSGEWSQWLDSPHRRPARSQSAETDADDEISEDELPAYIDDEPPPPTLQEQRGGLSVRPHPELDDHDAISQRWWWRTAVWTTTVAATVAAIGAIVAFNLRTTTHEPPPAAGPAGSAPTTTAAASTTALPASWEHATAGCTRARSGSITIGADPGDHSSPQQAILGFEWSYYVERDAALARTFTTPDAKVSDQETIQAGIDSQPDGVRYCVYITAADNTGKVWDVELQEQWPDDPEPIRYGQKITTITEHGKTLITGISRR
ncbi:hypothetical protein [Nocardia flavorosea]|uniref:hypothetical protein n=1 Tax=Nocardia flavorosea TaxID=53429 RepID=UPI002457F2CF|nr:hypothetical protein [Nocardia flavorosea]